MKVLVAGDWHSELHEEAVYQALIKLSHEPSRFSWCQYFKPAGIVGKLGLPLLKAQNKYMTGQQVTRLNRDFLERVGREQPDLVFVYRGTHIYPETLRKIRTVAPQSILVGYNNDDPFSPHYPRWKWRHFLKGVPEYDLMLAYRLHNIDEFKIAGARRVELLRSWFIPERNHPAELTEEERARFGCDVVFVGHYEDDGRLQYLEAIAKSGMNLRIFGPDYEWDAVLKGSTLLRKHVSTQLVWGEDYNRALCGAKVAMCFLSKINRDTYTRRCFEIPASGTLLMAERTADLQTLFQEGKEAMFFNEPDELVKSLGEVMSDEYLRRSICEGGRERVWKDGHDVNSRMNLLLRWVEKIKSNRDAAINN